MAELHSEDTEIVAVGGQMFSGVPLASLIGSNAASESNFARGPAHVFRYRVIKRVFDILFILAISPILLLVTALVALAIRIGSPGPIFFSHRRILRHGSFFTMWKFRTMCVNSTEVLDSYLANTPSARAEWLKSHKLRSDPRITPIGHFLRKTSLDELPQMWNVLNGSMSLVGPRPIVAAEVEKYGKYFADYCMVKPGLTGLWQVSGRSHCTYQERLELDRRYVREWSLVGDLKILSKTLGAVIGRHGAF